MIAATIASVALTIALENVIRLGFGNSLRDYDLPIERDWRFAGLRVGPQQLRDLIERSSILHDKVRRLDATIHAPVLEEQAAATPLDRQLGLETLIVRSLGGRIDLAVHDDLRADLALRL